MPCVFLGLGSNKGRRERYLLRALAELDRISGSFFMVQSSIYETEPVGIKEQPPFLNMAVELETDIDVQTLFGLLQEIEQKLGRTKSVRWGPREIDIDILYYGDTIMETEQLTLPHPGIPVRRFVLQPLSEIAPDFIDPREHRTIAALLKNCPDTSAVRRKER
ncbi:MAG: 2-amino-4-hydroxy-6-hydroxymethyldihydropteridine diphosphokinase [Bacteroidota bacterium]